MSFNVYLLDELMDKTDEWDDVIEKELEKYQDDILQLFYDSPEGQKLLEIDPEMGSWICHFIYYGFAYEECTLTSMNVMNVELILLEWFPKKIVTSSSDDAKFTIPELKAFWNFLKREFNLDNAEDVLELLDEIESDFKEEMNNSDNFSIGKSFFMSGESAGFDMTNTDDVQKFMAIYNTEITQKTPTSSVDALSSSSPQEKTSGIVFDEIIKNDSKSNKQKPYKMQKEKEKQKTTFDLYKLDTLEDWDEEAERSLNQYIDELFDLFYDSPEGQELITIIPRIGFWINRFIYYGFVYEGFTLPEINEVDTETILLEIFPRKISTFSPDESDKAIPELIAFWQFLKREYNLDNADDVLEFLSEIKSKFKKAMNDPSNFGMAKSFFMAGQNAGFDMTDEEESHQFMKIYNSQLLRQSSSKNQGLLGDFDIDFDILDELLEEDSKSRKPKVFKNQKKKKEKMAKKSRKTNRKKR